MLLAVTNVRNRSAIHPGYGMFMGIEYVPRLARRGAVPLGTITDGCNNEISLLYEQYLSMCKCSIDYIAHIVVLHVSYVRVSVEPRADSKLESDGLCLLD